MTKIFTKVIAPALLVAGSLGLGAAVIAAPAGASAKAAKTTVVAKTYSGTVKTVNAAKSSFQLTVGTTVYNVHYTAKTKFTTGSAATIKVGTKVVSVTGKLHKKTISATSISA
jgi:hypothetical protein